MITEDYVSFEIAKLLKEKGFDERVLTFYPPGDIPRPTLQMAMKWLREVHDIDVSVVPLRSHKEYLPRVEGDITSHDAIPCRKYEEACEVAIKYCLENLI